uniref:Complement component C7 n=1 Tax=Sphaeramia orbicularis TaxID=375764 RepID=A0A673AQJ2_9TELE
RTLNIYSVAQTQGLHGSIFSCAFLHGPFLSISFSCVRPVNCRWGPYGNWSECDGCTNTKVRTRHMETYAQFKGVPCPGEAMQTQQCQPQKGCPLTGGCGNRFRCISGQCISQSLVCNGDQDCEDGLDERHCEDDSGHYSCDLDKTPPNSELTGRGYDVLTGELRAAVINTLSFGGQCRKVFSGDHKVYYRLPQNILRYNFEVTVDNEESDESYESSWSYMQHVQSNALFGHDRRTFHKELTDNKAHRLIILKNKVELAQFQNSAPQYLTLSEGLWRALSSLPLTYDYPAYRQLLQTYGTHYMSEGSLGGEYQGLLELDRQALQSSTTTDREYQRCWRKVKRRFFRKKVKTVCEKLTQALSFRDGDVIFRSTYLYLNQINIVNVYCVLQLRPLYELVKEVQCAGLKKLHLKRATEQYLEEEHPCRCRPCRNNGRPLLTGSQCSCVCRPGTSGPACEVGAVIGEPAGVTDGSWSCWSSWGSCSGGQRSRSRSCNNPAPSGGGLHCTGPQVEQEPCEDPEVQHLQTMEPQCFGLSVPPPVTCGHPPHLSNGFIQNPRETYVVGNTVEYSCVSGFYLSGNAVAECLQNQTWSKGAMVCKSSSCWRPQLNSDITATPSKSTYDIGDSISLSCPPGTVLEGGVSQTMCSPSLQWSPSPEGAYCEAAPTTASPLSGLRCELWEDEGERGCVCKMPFECPTSLLLCAKVSSSRPRLLSVCQLGALRCVGRSFTLTNDSECQWPDETSCSSCGPGTLCDDSTNTCVCQRASECPTDSAPLCISSGEDGVSVTTSECEVGARRCAGERVAVIGIEACP